MKRFLKINCIIMAVAVLAASCHTGDKGKIADSLKMDSLKKDSLKKDSIKKIQAKAADTSKTDTVPGAGSSAPCGGVHPPCATK
jgi:hypothetical protein